MDFELMIRRMTQMTLVDRLRVQMKHVGSFVTTFLRPFSTKLAQLERRLVTNEITSRASRDYGSCHTRLRLVISLLLMMFLEVTTAWGQVTDGYYYIANYKPKSGSYNATNHTNTFYICPAINPNNTSEAEYYDIDMPFLTTYRTSQNDESLWLIKWVKDEGGKKYYNIIHSKDGYYLVYNSVVTPSNDSRLRVHIQFTSTNDDNALFEVKSVTNQTYYYIHPKNDINRSLNPSKGNKDSYVATNDTPVDGRWIGGMIGLWADNDDGKWYLETPSSSVTEMPVITNNFDGTITITATEGKIYYTSSRTAPTTDLTAYDSPAIVNLTDETSVIRAFAKADGKGQSAMTNYVLPKCAKPVVSEREGGITIECATSGSTIYYTTDGSDPSISDTRETYQGFFSLDESSPAVRAVAKSPGYIMSEEFYYAHPALVHSSASMTIMNGNYILASDFTISSSVGTETDPFCGIIDGGLNTISDVSYPLVAYANGATIKNVILDNVTISGGTNAGAICNEATGDTRIYNCGVLATDSEVETDKDGYTHITTCSSTISGSGYVGGIVGLLEGSSRVINCFSYANITGGDIVGGIVGNNNVATTSVSDNQKTMVMNCMFYGDFDLVSTTNRAPIYNGKNISNLSTESGVSNFNYFWAGASYVQSREIDTYNCALAVETRFLQRFEFFRPLLNSNRALAAWWATGSRDNKDEMMKWVLEPSQIGTSTPYPILKAPYDSEGHIIKYPSVVNIDADHAEAFSSSEEIKKTQYNQGRKFDGTFTINIRMGSGDGYHPAVGAEITDDEVTCNITDKDPKHFNFNYYKVQLPYYNDVGTNNYTKDSQGTSRVVTGWKIVDIASGSHSFSTSTTPSDASATVDEDGDITLTTPYNFADRKSTDKDKYSVSGRVFNQGAYFDVPEGVTSITIEPYWGKCVYVADPYLDVVYSQDMKTASNITTIGGGEKYSNNTEYDINGSSQKVYTATSSATAMTNAVNALNPSSSSTVYDNAIVLVGNVHSLDLSDKTDSKPYTIMSIDLDKDNEPDYSYILRFDGSTGRVRVHPVRVDFLNVIGLGMAQKSTGGKGTYNFGIMQPLGWFEVTNTALFRVTQFEYDRDPRSSAPMILHGGVIEQWVTVAETGNNAPTAANAVDYYHVGSNVWFKEFHLGAHQDRQTVVTPHPPISVTGGDYDEFYLTGMYNTPNNNNPDNAECYINGGRFGKVAGTGMQGLGNTGGTGGTNGTGNIIWQIDNADIDEFYAGGINAAHKAEGNIWTVISNSRVDQFCGGPKFGDMNNGKVVVTNANNCTFRTFFGAGYGGNSYNREYPKNQYEKYNYDWNTWLAGVYDNVYSSTYKGVATRIDYQFIPRSNNEHNVARLFVDYVSFSLATTHDVTSKLTSCTITKSPLGSLDLSYGLGNFYGGGSLGKVSGSVKSTLTDCIVEGNVFGAGYSVTLPKVAVMENSFQTEPYYDQNLGAYLEAELPATTAQYEWKPQTNSSTYVDNDNHILYAKAEDLDESNLGSVTGAVTLTLSGNTKVGTLEGGVLKEGTGNVFGGGEQSYVTGTTSSITVNLQGKTTVYGGVFGGGDHGPVEGSTKVNIEE